MKQSILAVYDHWPDFHPVMPAVCGAREAAIRDNCPAGLPADKVESGVLPCKRLQRNPVYTTIRSSLELAGIQAPAHDRVEKTLIATGDPGMPGLAAVSRKISKRERSEAAGDPAGDFRHETARRDRRELFDAA